MVAATSFVTAQSKSTEGAKSAAFEVASVKPNNTTTHPGIAFPPGRFSAINVPLKTLVLAAFNLQDFQLLEAPGWTASSRIRESMTDCDSYWAEAAEQLAKKGRGALKDIVRPHCGMRASYQVGGSVLLQFGSMSMSEVATRLAPFTNRAVLDRTGLVGLYDLDLEFMPPRGVLQSPGESPTSDVPSLSTALREQLGLRLESRRGPVNVLIVDHIEQPTAN
jgi:hypothetical protein